ncbi:MAG: hypothetical protein IPO27_12575 [Bacteroidetes bacterium]|nr:hypothetical protein [Bacteroidota bacterium]
MRPLQFNFNSDESFYLDTVYDKLLQQQVHKINAKGSTPLLSFSNPDVPKFAATFIIPSSGNYEIKITSLVLL